MENEFVEEKKNNTKKILIAIIIILLLALGGLTYYTFFVRDKEVNKPNPVVEPTKPIEEVDNAKKPLIYDDNIDSSCWYNGGDTIYNGNKNLFTDNPTKEDIVIDAVKNNKIDRQFNDLNNEEWQHYMVIRALVFSQLYQHVGKKELSNYSNVIYNDLCTNDTPIEERLVTCQLGLTEEEIKLADKKFLNMQEGGSCTYMSYKLSDIKNYINNVFSSYGNTFEKSFSFSYLPLNSTIFYDKNVDKIFIHWHSVFAPGYSPRYIISSVKENDVLKIQYMDYGVRSGNLVDENENIILKLTDDDINILEVIKKNISKFPQYEVSFKLVDGYYQFDSIVKK